MKSQTQQSNFSAEVFSLGQTSASRQTGAWKSLLSPFPPLTAQFLVARTGREPRHRCRRDVSVYHHLSVTHQGKRNGQLHNSAEFSSMITSAKSGSWD